MCVNHVAKKHMKSNQPPPVRVATGPGTSRGQTGELRSPGTWGEDPGALQEG